MANCLVMNVMLVRFVQVLIRNEHLSSMYFLKHAQNTAKRLTRSGSSAHAPLLCPFSHIFLGFTLQTELRR